MVKGELTVFDKSILLIFRQFECHHTRYRKKYQGTAFKLKFPIFNNNTIFMKPWLNNQIF